MIVGFVFLLIFGVFFLLLYQKHTVETKKRAEASREIDLRNKKTEVTIDRSIEKLHFILAAWLMKKNAAKLSNKEAFVVNFMLVNFSVDKDQAVFQLTEAYGYKIHVRTMAMWVNELFKTSVSKTKLFDFLFELIFADEDIIDRELIALVRLGELTGVSVGYIEKKVFQFRVNSAIDHSNTHLFSMQHDKRKALALTVLGLPFNATLKEVKTKYRKLMKELHPDKNQHLSEQMVQNNQIKLLEIQEAYEDLLVFYSK